MEENNFFENGKEDTCLKKMKFDLLDYHSFDPTIFFSVYKIVLIFTAHFGDTVFQENYF